MARRGQSVLFAVIVTFSAVSLAHAQAALQGSATAVAGVTVDEMVGRLLSFDRNRDGRVAKAELAERLQALVTRGDSDSDGALDRSEIRALVVPVPLPTFRAQAQAVGAYGFADQFQTSSRPRVDGAIDDLRLESSTRERALAIADAYVETLEITASEKLLQKMERVLTTAQIGEFRSQMAAAEARAAAASVAGGSGSSNIAQKVDPAGFIQRFRLPSPQQERAAALVEEYKSRIRFDQPYHAELLDQLSAILNPEELDNLQAALQRRPIIATEGLIAANLVRVAPRVIAPRPAPVAPIRDGIRIPVKVLDPPPPALPGPIRQ